MKFPEETKTGDLFWINNEPVRITDWNYTYGIFSPDRYFDIEFLAITKDDRAAASMVLIPMDYDFYGAEIRRMTSLEEELF